ncbi:MAG: tRNA (adenosine(37)-N6)-dimethylallyltransferase MiaA [Candidatus Scalindua sp. AMX11]|nr:MAG: tRNA (adenosine(37)-N6)-dimethylallyltransferase MiaA [Candidatus Scalindua sp.]NOG85020.1 tRNA (adenosine(37)-N6)-dimethylallyltransferase MiaA [Planctomycetota bacterium]RZV93075.1 MAG: tRNA (adenosine(37)-N6)-dimethylallyltransferase MiaA [Candidatus Scalindua sp. SCAELEC01]TDE66698.1 MAG: tRNA (adenosine(37)-N6)-dimethylallyltransferase MiaA [Candidatus Scalindua sp. AMX11]GJQ58004.1 MAG: tRNA dimethylallyltransferase [Candidatus Scalindua sp.]
MSKTTWILTGTTASDKTDIGFHIAQEIDGEIISADSMLIYRGMDIGTAKPTLEMRKKIPHHLIDIVDPWESYSVGKYVEDVENVIGALRKKMRKCIIVGGTPLYIKGIRDGIFRSPEADWKIREELERCANERGNLYVHGILEKIDPITAKKLHPNNLRRIIRAIEVYKRTGKQMSYLQELSGKEKRNCTIVCITREREDRYRRIHKRVDTMFNKGLVDEVQSLLDSPNGIGRQAGQALGYREVIQYLNGECTLDEAKDLLKLHTRRFSKRQMTWFRSFSNIKWVEVKEEDNQELILEKVILAFQGDT